MLWSVIRTSLSRYTAKREGIRGILLAIAVRFFGLCYLASMLTYRRHRYLTRWRRRIAFALAIALLLAAVWHSWHVLHPEPVPAPSVRLA